MKNVPEIRLKGFNGEWKENKLGDIGNTFVGLSGKNKSDFGHGDGRYITYMNVFSNPIASSNQIENIEIDNSQCKVIYGDVFFTTSSETPEEVGMSSVWLKRLDNVYLNSFCFGYRLFVDVDLYFMAYYLRSSSFRRKITFLAQGISRFNISKNKVMEVVVLKPSTTEEQQSIGRFFQNLDNLLTEQKNKLENLQKMKKSMLCKMFPKEGQKVPEIRFKGFEKDWEEKKLGEISSKVIEKNSKLEFSETFTNSAEMGIISQQDYFDHDISNINNIGNYYVVRPNNFVYNPRISTSAPVGPIKRNKLGRIGVMSPLYYVFKAEGIDYTFLEKYFETNLWHNFMKINGDSGARSDRFSIKDSIFTKMPILTPSPEEQALISFFIESIYQGIYLQQKKIEQLQHLKLSLLSKMFV